MSFIKDFSHENEFQLFFYEKHVFSYAIHNNKNLQWTSLCVHIILILLKSFFIQMLCKSKLFVFKPVQNGTECFP